MEGSLTEQRGAQYILVRTRANRIETKCREDIPRGSLTVVLVTAITVGTGSIHAVHYLTKPILGLPRFPGVVIKVNHVLDGMVAMGIVTHIHHCHLDRKSTRLNSS